MSTAVTTPSASTRDIIGFVASAIGGFTVVVFGILLLYEGHSQNIVTWLTLATLDGLIFYHTIKTGSGSAWLSGSYMVGAGLVAIASLYNAKWHWGTAETITTAGVIAILALRARLDSRRAIIAGVAVMIVGGIPMMIDYWYVPFFPSWWMWGITAVCDFIVLFAAKKWSVEDSLFAGSGGLFCTVMTALALR